MMIGDIVDRQKISVTEMGERKFTEIDVVYIQTNDKSNVVCYYRLYIEVEIGIWFDIIGMREKEVYVDFAEQENVSVALTLTELSYGVVSA